jgi:streptomycin 6-kinase
MSPWAYTLRAEYKNFCESREHTAQLHRILADAARSLLHDALKVGNTHGDFVFA